MGRWLCLVDHAGEHFASCIYEPSEAERRPSRHGWRHCDDHSECMEPLWCARAHYRTPDLALHEERH